MAEMVLFALNTGAQDDDICNLQSEWEIPVPALSVSLFIVPLGHVNGEEDQKEEGVLIGE